jgi:hypothetical protein
MQDGAAGYRVHRRARGSDSPETLTTLSADESIYLDESVESGDFYWYSVSILSDTSESEPSGEISVEVR